MKRLFFIFTLLFFVVSGFLSVDAQTCDIRGELYGNCSTKFSLDISRTVCGMTKSGLDNLGNDLIGENFDTVANCEAYVVEQLGSDSITAQCSGSPTVNCESLLNTYNAEQEDDGATGYRYQRPTNSGSMLAFYYTISNYMRDEPVPLNMAYFFNDHLARVPVAGQIFAQELDYGHTLINAIYDVWRVTRNIAYGMMSVILLIIGILIITRKRINQQVVVSVQYAMPRLVLVMILIAFSYTIGAFLASAGWSLFNSASTIVETIFNSLGGLEGQTIVGSLIGAVVVILVAAVANTITVPLLLIVVIVFLGVLFYYRFVALKQYLKLVFFTISAPIEFAASAIPGSESKLTGWFQKAGIAAISLAVMGFTEAIVYTIGLQIVGDYSTYAAGGGALLQTLAVPFFFIYGYSVAAGMPGKVEAFILGSPPGKRK